MKTPQADCPIVMCFSGHDPSGGAGIQADIETLASFGCHCSPVITALTTQDSKNIKHFSPTSHTMLIDQARTVMADFDISAFKIGMLGSLDNIEAIGHLLADNPGIPVVLDPVMAAGGGKTVSDKGMIDAIINLLMPQVTICTPNTEEARALAPGADCLNSCAQEIRAYGCENVLITGTHEPGEKVINRLWAHHMEQEEFSWERLEGDYHGSGCTLATSIAALLAHGLPIATAVRDGQTYTWNSLKHGRQLGNGQKLADHFFWAKQQEPYNWRMSN